MLSHSGYAILTVTCLLGSLTFDRAQVSEVVADGSGILLG